MKQMISWLGVASLALFGCAGGEKEEKQAGADSVQTGQATETAEDPEQAALHKPDPAGTYGEGVALTEGVAIASILEAPETYEGQRVLVEGTIEEVCPMRGCWVEVADPTTLETIRVKVHDGEIVFPLSAKGSPARVEGTVEKIELSEEQARAWMKHEAEEKGEDFDPDSVQGAQVIWRLQGHGAEIAAAPRG